MPMKHHPRGFTRNTAKAFWLTCNACGDAEMFYGGTKEDDARGWYTTHRKECPARKADKNR